MRRATFTGVLCALLLSSVAFVGLAIGSDANLADQEVLYRGSSGEMVSGLRCAAPDQTPESQQQVQEQIQKWIDANGIPQTKAQVSIPVAVHVIRYNSGSGDVSDSQINQQISVLNSAYNGTSFSFSLVSID